MDIKIENAVDGLRDELERTDNRLTYLESQVTNFAYEDFDKRIKEDESAIHVLQNEVEDCIRRIGSLRKVVEELEKEYRALQEDCVVYADFTYLEEKVNDFLKESKQEEKSVEKLLSAEEITDLIGILRNLHHYIHRWD